MAPKSKFYVYVLQKGRMAWRKDHQTYESALAEANRLYQFTDKQFDVQILESVLTIKAAPVQLIPLKPIIKPIPIVIKKRRVAATQAAA